MTVFNLNDFVYVCPSEYGVKEAIKEVGQKYWDVCIEPNKTAINDKTYYRIQWHEIITLWRNATWATHPCPIDINILIDD
jgi:hypothetical protein